MLVILGFCEWLINMVDQDHLQIKARYANKSICQQFPKVGSGILEQIHLPFQLLIEAWYQSIHAVTVFCYSIEMYVNPVIH